MIDQDTLAPATQRQARERLLWIGQRCRRDGRHDLAIHVERAATSGMMPPAVAQLIVLSPYVVPTQNPGWEWLPSPWLLAFFDDDGKYHAYWTWPLPERSS